MIHYMFIGSFIFSDVIYIISSLCFLYHSYVVVYKQQYKKSEINSYKII
jgi:hypothetical protein